MIQHLETIREGVSWDTVEAHVYYIGGGFETFFTVYLKNGKTIDVPASAVLFIRHAAPESESKESKEPE